MFLKLCYNSSINVNNPKQIYIFVPSSPGPDNMTWQYLHLPVTCAYIISWLDGPALENSQICPCTDVQITDRQTWAGRLLSEWHQHKSLNRPMNSKILQPFSYIS